ncbi:pseudouridylate synthase TRUB1 isoform X2 [Paroedura picta]|uniref:pseudouridylate synthase TRUB1 isoform X2 n=1 Tax=Paroedura picta TaxID=143630 RepID=UPI004057A12A
MNYNSHKAFPDGINARTAASRIHCGFLSGAAVSSPSAWLPLQWGRVVRKHGPSSTVKLGQGHLKKAGRSSSSIRSREPALLRRSSRQRRRLCRTAVHSPRAAHRGWGGGRTVAGRPGNKMVAAKLLSLSGLFAVYKPKGRTSADVLNHLKAKLLAEAGLPKRNRNTRKHNLKIGHGGILDKAATGVLVVGIGEGTKMLCDVLAGSKKYLAIGHLGKATNTFDSLGKVTEEKPYHHITKEELENVLQKFTGNIMQVPPLYSALKKDGQRLSALAAKGEVVEAKSARPVIVYSLSLKNFKPPLFILELSSCASVHELTRTKQGPFTLEEHALYEDKWTIDEIGQSLEHCMPLLSVEPSSKKLKTELSEEHTMNCEDK